MSGTTQATRLDMGREAAARGEWQRAYDLLAQADVSAPLRGGIRRRRGDIRGAEEALRAAHEAGWDPQPGVALVQLANGEVALAVQSIRDALRPNSRAILKAGGQPGPTVGPRQPL